MVERKDIMSVSDSYIYLIAIIIIYNVLLAFIQIVCLIHAGKWIYVIYFIIMPLICCFIIRRSKYHAQECRYCLPEHIR